MQQLKPTSNKSAPDDHTHQVPTTLADIQYGDSLSHRTINSVDRDVAFDNTMLQARTHMGSVDNIISQCIHNKSIELVLGVLSSTIARPRAIAYGSLCSFVATVLSYCVAKYYGYTVPDTVPIILFLAGWALGLVIDYVILLFRGRQVTARR